MKREYKFSEEHRAKIGEANRKRVLSEATKEKIRQKALARTTKYFAPNKKNHIDIDGIPHKQCGKCGISKPLSFYNKHSSRWDGLTNACRDCHTRRGKDWYNKSAENRNKTRYNSLMSHRRLKKEAIEYLGGECSDCGFVHVVDINESVFDFHHRDRAEKDFTITAARARILETIKDELDKCDLLCANCHRLRHAREQDEKEKAPLDFSNEASS